ncbi:P-loop containing nucleoside triphosphate hydrolase protein [Plectosphaerella plurivora]|uniref:P-loop containing nucleoside triphosphate hydrolase protein n=1 Tax=Plectosphaerella plurivora TaxID=936078 RepID=A0A9P8V2I9_9PEZI|nr:P-loop containing nucleoside triphosphate hydrolase protein [Plectosphaerella plurivora]
MSGLPPEGQAPASVAKDCAIIIDGSIFASGDALAAECTTKIKARLVLSAASGQQSWIGIVLNIPFSDQRQIENQKTGFGVRYFYDQESKSHNLSTHHKICIRLPRGGYTQTVAEASDATRALFPDVEDLVKATIRLHDGAASFITGYGIPYTNSDRQLEAVVNQGEPILDGIALKDVLALNEFSLVVASTVPAIMKLFNEQELPPPFTYPYGNEHAFSVNNYKMTFSRTKSKRQLLPAYAFDDLNSFIAVSVQAVVQDFLWLHVEAEKMANTPLPAYYVVRPQTVPSEFFIIVPNMLQFRKRHDAAWRRFTRKEGFELLLFSPRGKRGFVRWPARLLLDPEEYPELSSDNHPIKKTDMILQVRRPTKGSKFAKHGLEYRRVQLLRWRARRQEEDDALLAYGLGAKPSKSPYPGFNISTSRARRLHRQLMCGHGFHEWLAKDDPFADARSITSDDSDDDDGIVQGMAATSIDSPSRDKLPTIDYLDGDQGYIDALVAEALPQDRDRFRKYMSDRPLGIGIVTGAAGFGKTTAMAVVALTMGARLGKIFCSGPSNVSVDNLATRIYEVSCTVTDRYNAGPKGGHARRKLVVRGFKTVFDMDAFRHLVRLPHDIEGARPKVDWGTERRWQLDYSVAYWLLALFRSPAVPPLHDDDAQVLHDMRDHIDNREDLKFLCAYATGRIGREEFIKSNPPPEEVLEALFDKLVREADFGCATPALSENNGTWRFYKKMCGGVIIDEAAAMHRSDLACAWGNVATPCFLGGDPVQLPPTLTADGGISGLEYLQAMGVPVYRLRVQLRMAKGLFDAVSRFMYPDLDVEYGACCDVDEPRFQSGHILEDMLQERFPELKPPREGHMNPVFIHCNGAEVLNDEMSGSKRSPDQAKVALDLAVDLIRNGVPATEIVLLTPYTANVNVIAKMRKEPEYIESLAGMAKSDTIDGYQGQEKDITIIVMGTKHVVGPGFTCNKQRLNVLLTRSRCGLVLVGDVHVMDDMSTKEVDGEDAIPMLVETATGEMVLTKAEELKGVHRTLWAEGRVVTVDAKKKK